MAKTPSEKSSRSSSRRKKTQGKASKSTSSSPKKDPLAGTLINKQKHSKTDPFAGMKRKKRKQQHGGRIEEDDLDDLEYNKRVNLETKLSYGGNVQILADSTTKTIAIIGAEVVTKKKDFKVKDWSPSATEGYGNNTLGKDSFGAGDMYAYKEGKPPKRRWTEGRVNELYNVLSKGKHHIVVEMVQGDLKKYRKDDNADARWPDYLLLHKIINKVEGSDSSTDDDRSEDSD